MIKMIFTIEMDRETVKDLFESCEVKFSVKKLKELQEDLDNTSVDVQEELEQTFEEIVSERIQELFE